MNCIGFKTLDGVRVDYYHHTINRRDGREFLVINHGGDVPDVMLWQPNEFVPYTEFSRLELKYIKYDFKTTRKRDVELLENDEKAFFKHIYPKTKGVWTRDETNEMLSAFDSIDLSYKGKITITDDMASNHPILSELVGYKVSVDTDGDHRNDGQMVDYSFTFISPLGETSFFTTEMCLMVGWNHCHSVTIK